MDEEQTNHTEPEVINGDWPVSKIVAECEILRDLSLTIASAEADLKAMKSVREQSSKNLAQILINSKIQSLKLDVGTAHIRRDKVVSKMAGVSSEEACEALRDAGLGEFVSESYNWKAVTGRVGELLEKMPEGTSIADALPEKMQGVFQAMQIPRVRILKS